MGARVGPRRTNVDTLRKRATINPLADKDVGLKASLEVSARNSLIQDSKLAHFAISFERRDGDGIFDRVDICGSQTAQPVCIDQRLGVYGVAEMARAPSSKY